uniref:Uncharacterized protein n=1 Tax=Eutreptiella gymnastica TaxID=73025 RepID=A0A7S1NVW7_9EUGL|mmetsp:Transcript_98207/g.169182  ORF Transcript_98207/g.169182 Transcript_98207/m.169182 type:complete len:236 (+) Transcript_98207:3-710(+)
MVKVKPTFLPHFVGVRFSPFCVFIWTSSLVRKIARRLWNAEYNKKQGSLTLKSAKKRLSVAVYPSGKMTCMGARSEATARKELRKYARLVQRSIPYSEIPDELRTPTDMDQQYVYHRARFLGFRVANIKAEWELGFPVDLHGFCENYGQHFSVYYEPDIFPALKLSLEEPKLTMQVFTTGTVGVTGATSVKDINFACKEVLYSLAQSCQLHSTTHLQQPSLGSRARGALASANPG